MPVIALFFHPYWGEISSKILRKKMGLMRRFTNTIKSCLGQQSRPNQKLHRGKYLLYFSVWIQYLACFQNPALSTARGGGSLITSPIRHFAAVTGKYTFSERWQLWNFLQKSYVIWREVCWENMFSLTASQCWEKGRERPILSFTHTSQTWMQGDGFLHSHSFNVIIQTIIFQSKFE